MNTLKLFIFCAFLAYVAADCYMQNPRGSNDRLNEDNTDRDNANRLFDSQNNAQGGYCYGPQMTFYAGSQLQIQWTIQHGCGRSPALMCNLVIQYMCSQADATAAWVVRDGTTTNTIGVEGETDDYSAKDANGNYEYGMHEPWQNYAMCENRERNMGLFIADREDEGGLNSQRWQATYTRQDNNGGNDRHGYECTEERDYYPYWAPSFWHDIAILTHDTAWCSFYESESQNVLERYYCTKPETSSTEGESTNTIYSRWITQDQCLNPTSSRSGYAWNSWPAWNEKAPDCIQTTFSRENHLGNVIAGFEAHYNWTLPTSVLTNASDSSSDCVSDDNCVCVLRIRYNISAADASPDAESDYESYGAPYPNTDYTKNGKNSPITQNPYVELDNNVVQLAINTDQFGRTFQDRSYTFKISPRPSGVDSTARIHNLNVKGKRGNIVETYPATEYLFQPQFLNVAQGDYIHFQWTGCDTNPAGNAGEGADSTDRSNIMQMTTLANNYPITDDWVSSNPDSLLFPDSSLRSYMTYLGQTGCLSSSQLTDGENDPYNCFKLNAASQHFDGGLIAMNSTGTYYYMSSRNNDFTNRGQKATMVVSSFIPTWAIVLVGCGAVVFCAATVLAILVTYAKANPHSAAGNFVSKL